MPDLIFSSIKFLNFFFLVFETGYHCVDQDGFEVIGCAEFEAVCHHAWCIFVLYKRSQFFLQHYLLLRYAINLFNS